MEIMRCILQSTMLNLEKVSIKVQNVTMERYVAEIESNTYSTVTGRYYCI